MTKFHFGPIDGLSQINPRKSESLKKKNKPSHPDLFMFNTVIPNVQFHKRLGIVLTDVAQNLM